MEKCETPFGSYAEEYRKAGLWVRPAEGKACKEKGWQNPDNKLPKDQFERWLEQKADRNIGAVMGSPFPDGTRLGALDVDHDDYMPLLETLFPNHPCGRIGQKGAVYFVRYRPEVLNQLKEEKIRVKGDNEYGLVLEYLFDRKFCILPPSIHPETGQPYRWIGTPLHQIDFNKLPVIGG